MTKVIIADKGENIHVRVDGHNEDSKVCASISTLVLTFAQVILDCNIACKTMELEEGYADITISKKHIMGMYALDVSHALSFIKTGFRMLAKDYPDYVNVTLKG